MSMSTRQVVSKAMFSRGGRPLAKTAISMGRGMALKAAASARKGCVLGLPSGERCALRISCVKCVSRARGISIDGANGISFVLGRSTMGVRAMIMAKAHAPGLLGSIPVMAHIVATSRVGGMSTARVKSLLRTRLPKVRFSCSVSRRISLGVRKFNKGTMLFLISNRHLTNRALSGVSCGQLGVDGIRHVRVMGNTTSSLCNSGTMKKIMGVVDGIPTRP